MHVPGHALLAFVEVFPLEQHRPFLLQLLQPVDRLKLMSMELLEVHIEAVPTYIKILAFQTVVPYVLNGMTAALVARVLVENVLLWLVGGRCCALVDNVGLTVSFVDFGGHSGGGSAVTDRRGDLSGR